MKAYLSSSLKPDVILQMTWDEANHLRTILASQEDNLSTKYLNLVDAMYINMGNVMYPTEQDEDPRCEPTLISS